MNYATRGSEWCSGDATLIHEIGWRYKKFRIFYYKITGKWSWGIMGAIQTPECFPGIEKKINTDFEEHLEQIFK